VVLGRFMVRGLGDRGTVKSSSSSSSSCCCCCYVVVLVVVYCRVG